MRVTVVTPDQSYFDGEARSITLQAVDGEIGILPRHAPLIARLGHGIARILDVHEVYSLDHTTLLHVETRHDTYRFRHSKLSTFLFL